MAALRDDPAGMNRVDCCPECWAGFDRAGVLAFWQTSMPRPDQPAAKLFVDDSVLCDLFERLADANDPDKLNFRFVLGLILMRKRLLAYETTRIDNGCEIWIVRLRGSQNTLEMLNPRLTEDQVRQVGQQLSQIMREEL